MDYQFCLNTFCLPANNSQDAYSLFILSLYGVLELGTPGKDCFLLFFDGDDIDICSLAPGFSYLDFKCELNKNREIDLLQLLIEMQDKTPAFDTVSEEVLDEISKVTSFLPHKALDGNFDLLFLAFIQNWILLSLPTDHTWEHSAVSFQYYIDNGHYETADIENVASVIHGKEIRKRREFKIIDIIPNATISNDFMSWFESLRDEDRGKIANIFRYCNSIGFESRRPIIGKIDGSKITNLKEICVGNPHGQKGKIRVLFTRDSERKVVILSGFIKHSDDYTEPIRRAENVFYAL